MTKRRPPEPQREEIRPKYQHVEPYGLGAGVASLGERWTGHDWSYCLDPHCPARAGNRHKPR